MKTTTSVLLALCFVIWSCNNSANTETKTDSSGTTLDTSNNPPKDAGSATMNMTVPTDAASSAFLTSVANVGMAEVQLGQIAQQKGTYKGVKDFAAMMVQDHTAANDKVKSLATQRSVTLPTVVDGDHQKMIDDLNKKTGKAFDKSYIDAMVKGHEKVIKNFQDASGKVGDTEVKAFINNTLPTLQTHLDSAKAVQKRLK